MFKTTRKKTTTTSLLAGVLAGLLTTGAVTTASRAEEGVWRYEDKTDAMGVRSRIAITLSDPTPRPGNLPPRQAALLLREQEGVASVLLILKNAAPLCESHGQAPVQVRFDGGQTTQATCGREISGATEVVFLGPVVPIWLAINGSETMSLAVTVAGEGRAVFTFPVAGLSMKRLLDADEVAAVIEIGEAIVQKKEAEHLFDYRPLHNFRERAAQSAESGAAKSGAAKSLARGAKPDLRL